MKINFNKLFPAAFNTGNQFLKHNLSLKQITVLFVIFMYIIKRMLVNATPAINCCFSLASS